MASQKQPETKRWRFGLILSFFVPFVIFGFAAEHMAFLQGQKDVERWSHLVSPTSVSANEHLYQSAFWFIGVGVVAGLIGALLFYLFTRCRRSC
ncbi:MAG: hypothetical protein KC777_24370 [Cyanobacteria bacterium HKST-UBA02]|nr:hypothetical protein [Cyanobacteria bacterium HKST-UBA02]